MSVANVVLGSTRPKERPIPRIQMMRLRLPPSLDDIILHTRNDHRRDRVGLHDEIPRHVLKENNRWLHRGAFKASLVRIWGMSYKIDHHHAFH